MNIELEKQDKRELLKIEKDSTLLKNENLIKKYGKIVSNNENISCDLHKDNISVVFCENKYQKELWSVFVHLTSSLPYRGAVGRQVKLFLYCGKHVIGMVHLTSPLAQLRLRDKFLNWSYEDKWKNKQINKIYNIETCVPTRKYSQYLTGKLLVYCIFSNEVINYLTKKYNNTVIGFETTSLFGKSSMYNRIPFLKYLGLTDGNSAIYISDSEWKKVLDEYYTIYPSTKTNRMAPVKFQIVDKLSKYYEKNNKEFPYEYRNVNYRRGIYFGYVNNINLNYRIDEWRKRWYLPRLSRIHKFEK